MHVHQLEHWQHSHNFLVEQHQAEKKTTIVLLLTFITMITEIAAGTIFGSMALLADGWHMATHAAAFGITVFAYRYARRHVNDPRYTFGTGKVSIMGGFSSAIILAMVAFLMLLESGMRLFHPAKIQFNEAILIACIGLIVNLVSAVLLQDDHDHNHHAHDHPVHKHAHQYHQSQVLDHQSDHQPALSASSSAQHAVQHTQNHSHQHATEHNLRAAYIHVIADALTSILAITALILGKFYGWFWLDAMMGLVGAVIIAKWSLGLLQETGLLLLDGTTNKQIQAEIMQAIEADADNRITDLHVWNVSPHHLAATISLVTHYPQSPNYYKNLLNHLTTLSHIIIEVHPCQGEACIAISHTLPKS